MNQDIKERWVKALRDGEINGEPIVQGRGTLRSDSEDGLMSLCCLGVLCELAVADGVVSRHQVIDEEPYYEYGINDEDNDSAILPGSVRTWARLKRSNPEVYHGDLEQSLARLNDGYGFTFAQIADVIEKNL